MFEQIDKKVEKYIKQCPSCEQANPTPNNHSICLTCLTKKLKFNHDKTICLQCGEIIAWVDIHTKFCFLCARKNIEDAQTALEAELDDRQKKVFEDYRDWTQILRIMSNLDE